MARFSRSDVPSEAAAAVAAETAAVAAAAMVDLRRAVWRSGSENGTNLYLVS